MLETTGDSILAPVAPGAAPPLFDPKVLNLLPPVAPILLLVPAEFNPAREFLALLFAEVGVLLVITLSLVLADIGFLYILFN